LFKSKKNSAAPASEPQAAKQLWRNKRVRTPTILQMEAVECGAAALGIVLGYHGRFIPLERLREECGVSRDGSKASNVIRAASKYGVTAKGYRKELEGLRTLPLPLILFWNFNHFMVLEGIRGKKVYLNDPAGGPRRVTWEELDQSFTGVALSIQPAPGFQKGGSKPGVLKALGSRVGAIRVGIVFAILAGLALVLPGLVIPAFSKIFVDDILVGMRWNWMKPLLVAMVATLLVQGFFLWLQQASLFRQQVKLSVITSAQFFLHVLRLPFVFFTQRYGGEVGSRVQLNDRVALLLTGELASAVLSFLTAFFFVILMAAYNAFLAAIVVLAAGLNLVVLRYVSRKRVDLNQRMLQEQGKLYGTSMGGLSLIETIKATASESEFFSRWAGYHAKASSAQQDLSWWTVILNPVPNFLAAATTATVLGLGALRVMEGQMTMGMLLAFQSLMFAFMAPVARLVRLGASFQEAVGGMNRIDDVLRYEQDKIYSVKAPQAGRGSFRLTGYLEIRNLTFGYSRLDPPLIQDFCLNLLPGARVAIVGSSGSGKSTIARLVCGLCEPWEGEILFDCKRREEIPREVLNNSIAYVDQDIFIFEGSVRENLSMWNTAVPDADVVRAGRDAAIHEEISGRSGGYDCTVDEAGRNFSGGQRQRLEIARALVCNPSILVLDEATSALDPRVEKEIDENLRRRGCTCLIIAHRLSTIRDCDEIIVLERGKVVQRGTHEELVSVEGPYRRLILA
jgi:NHLM bacteriocin system ABC transporter peptidase/ATP-binding protein